jgi:hypothetical protein
VIQADLWRRVASDMDRVLKGAKRADPQSAGKVDRGSPVCFAAVRRARPTRNPFGLPACKRASRVIRPILDVPRGFEAAAP